METDYVSHDELLEEMLREEEKEFIPKFRNRLNTFIETFNSLKVQNKIIDYFKEFNEKLRAIDNASSLFNMICSFREFFDFFARKYSPLTLFKWLQHSGLFALVNDARFNFFEEELSANEREKRLLNILDNVASTLTPEIQNKKFEDYIASWQKNQRKFRTNEIEIEKDICEMKREKEEADQAARQVVHDIINDVCNCFEPLREQLQYIGIPIRMIPGDAANLIVLRGARSVVTALAKRLTSRCASAKRPTSRYALDKRRTARYALAKRETARCNSSKRSTARFATAKRPTARYDANMNRASARFAFQNRDKFIRRKKKDWFEDVIKFINVFLMHGKDKMELQKFIAQEMLEDDFAVFKLCTCRWLRDFCLNTTVKNLFIPGDVFNADVDRMQKFMYAVVINQPVHIHKHITLVNKLIQTAAHTTADKNNITDILPCVSYGQLPLPTASGRRAIHFAFVLSSDESTDGAESVMNALSTMFPTITGTSIEIEEKNNITVIHVDVDTGENIPALIERNISRLSYLSIRAVLVGSLGHGGGFRHAMNPKFNRIYGTESADGFITTTFPRYCDRGGEPYFCPTGWVRYAIDVGMSAFEFERAYRDWPVAYHGTSGHFSTSLLLNGLTASGAGGFLRKGVGHVYLSPSIEYSGHPRYARVWKVKNKFVQMVLQVRVKKQLIYSKEAGTLPWAKPEVIAIDSNFKDNKSLEWIIRWPPGKSIETLNGIIIYGLMLRVSKEHPRSLPHCAWWKQSGPKYWDCE